MTDEAMDGTTVNPATVAAQHEVAPQPLVNPASAALDAVAKRRGRHPKDCTCDKCTTKRATAPKLDPTTGNKILSETEKKLAKESILALTRVSDVITLCRFRKIVEPLPENIQKDFLSHVPMSEPIRQGIAESGALVAEKHGVAANMPEFVLCANIAAYVSGLTMVAMEVRKTVNEYAKLKAETAKNPSDGAKR